MALKMKVFILAGGSGERFWPLSTPENPKQFLKLIDGKSLLRVTFERFQKEVALSNIYVITTQEYVHKVWEELPELPKENVIGEPMKRNTAPACVMAAYIASEGDVMFIAPADHYIPDEDAFWNVVMKARSFIDKKEDVLMTFGIVPTRPETGYGYIEIDVEVEEDVYKVKMFREKPSYEVAEEYVESGNFLWNSGMFMWKREVFLREMKKHAPKIFKAFNENQGDFEKAYLQTESVSVDYALMEKSDKIHVVKATFGWSDVGNWKSLKELGYKGKLEPVVVDADEVFAITDKPLVIVGVSDVVVVETEEGILVASQKDLERIREGVRKVLQRSAKKR